MSTLTLLTYYSSYEILNGPVNRIYYKQLPLICQVYLHKLLSSQQVIEEQQSPVELFTQVCRALYNSIYLFALRVLDKVCYFNENVERKKILVFAIQSLNLSRFEFLLFIFFLSLSVTDSNSLLMPSKAHKIK